MEFKTLVVFRFTLGDVEDPDLYAAEPLWNWQQSDAGKWIMNNAEEPPMWHRSTAEYSGYGGYSYSITAKLTDIKTTEWILKYGLTDT